MEGHENGLQPPDPAGEVVDQVGQLSQALAQFAADDLIAVELWRVEGTGRGVNGSLDYLETREFDMAAGAGIGAVVRELFDYLRDQHEGGRFRLIVRDNATGRMLMNQPANIRRTLTARAPVKPEEKPDAVAQLLAGMAEQQRRADERLERVLAELKPKPGGIDDDLNRLVKLKEVLGASAAPVAVQQGGALGTLTELLALKEGLDKLAGGGGKDDWMSEAVPEALSILRDMMTQGKTSEADDEEDEQPEGDAKLREKLAGFAGKIEQAARGGMAPEQAAKVALSVVPKPAVLVRMARDGSLVPLLCEVHPPLLRHVSWLERVRVEIVKAGQPKITAPKGADGADDSRADPGRRGGRASDARQDANAGGSQQAAATGATGSGGAGEGDPAVGKRRTKDVPRPGGKAAPVRSRPGAVRKGHKGR